MSATTDNVLVMTARFDGSQLKAGLTDLAATTQVTTGQMAQAYTVVDAAVKNLADAQLQLGAAAATGNQQAAAIIAQYAVAAREAQAAYNQLTVAVDDETASEDANTAATTRGISARIAASTSLHVMEGNLTGTTRAAGAFLATTLGLGPVLQAAFPVIGAVALLSVFYQIGSAIASATDYLAGWTAEVKKSEAAAVERNIEIISKNAELKDSELEASAAALTGTARVVAEEKILQQEKSNTISKIKEVQATIEQVTAEDAQLAFHISDLWSKTGFQIHQNSERIAENNKSLEVYGKLLDQLSDKVKYAFPAKEAALQGDKAKSGIDDQLAEMAAVTEAHKQADEARIAYQESYAKSLHALDMSSAADELATLLSLEDQKHQIIIKALQEQASEAAQRQAATGASEAATFARINGQEEAETYAHQERSNAIVTTYEEAKLKLVKEAAADYDKINEDSLTVLEAAYQKDEDAWTKAQLKKVTAYNAAQQKILQTEEKIATQVLAEQVKSDDFALKHHDESIDQWTAHSLAALNNWYNTENALLTQQLIDAETIYGQDKEQYQALIDKKVELDQQYATKHQQIMTQMEQFDANALAKERSEFNSAFVGILTGQTTFSQGMLKLGESMFEGMANNILKMLETQKLAGLKQILVDAKTAAGNSYSWASAWGGPVAGAIAAAAAFAGVMAFGAFEAGGLVPNTGFHKLHEQEMVLPKNISNLITSSVSNFTTTGGQQNSSELHTHLSPNITAMDAKSVNAIMDDQYERFVAKIKTDFRHMRFA